jgi:hypothetical protein
MKISKRPFGPFLDVPCDDIKPAGFKCRECRHPVEKLAKVLPNLVPRMFFYSCKCGMVTTWEDEAQPQGSRVWRLNTNLLKRSGAKVLIFNGARKLSAGFSGIN